ncbi:tryptophan 7-halogenase [Temperatibacter marinus]|uniref:Tryptophan 7-halogenase n=1 Tax=Temperatibacter marinus TaxID=1456591 RepID=A0AA52HAF7_9PROT|nr:tryptophan halogenase family protein [Temperatibacter marinus]WND03577.1 tryptophan 7-halogenase [Temperatibacter marinus]
MNDEKIKSICILGGGTAGWMTAAGLAKKLESLNIEISLVESEQIGTVGVGEATLPHIRYFNKTLGLDEAEFMKATNATIKLGIEFCNWGKLGDRYIHPFGDFGAPIKDVDFYHYWIKLNQQGLAKRLSDYSYPIVAAENGKCRHPSENIHEIESTFGYAYQFDAGLYAKYLRAYAEKKGVHRQEGKVKDVAMQPETGFITTLTLDDDSTIEADLYIDCSGFRGVLIEQSLKTGFDDWSQWLPCNRAIAIPCESAGRIDPYTRATALTAGWQWRIPLQHRTGNGHVYWNEHISDDEALSQLLSNLDGKPLADPNQLYFTTGKRKKLWNKNVVCIGLSGGFLEPLESTSIYLIQEGITALLELFPDKACRPSDQNEYNRRMDLQFDRIRDFLLLHYVATQRDDSPMWQYFSQMTLPDSLTEKINAWTERGLIQRYEHGAFLPPSWVAVMAGQNLIPRGFDPRVNALSDQELNSQTSAIADAIEKAVSQTTDHMDFLKLIGAAIDETKRTRT